MATTLARNSSGVVREGDLPMEGARVQMQISDQQVRNAKRTQKYILVAAFILVVILLGTVIGLAVGLSQRNKDEVAASRTTPSKDDIRNYLVTNSISDSQTFEIVTSPQSQALAFVESVGADIPSDRSSLEAYKFMETYILAVMYFSLGGPAWISPVNFLDPEYDACWWNSRLFFLNGEDVRGAFCYEEGGPVVAIRIVDHGAAGTIPSELGKLTELDSINFRTNLYIEGQIPSSFQDLTKLTYLALHFNQLTGTFPSWIGNLSNLEVFAVSNNQISGNFPQGITQLSALQILAVDDNLMTGDFNRIDSLTKLRLLYLEDNGFTATVDSTLFTELVSLEQLDMSDNQLVGSVPAHFFSYQNLTILDLHGNRLGQSLPQSISNNDVLEFLALQSNLLTGLVPPSMSNLVALTHLDLSTNQFGGSMPEDLGTLINLKYLFLADTQFDRGTIPSTYQDLVNIEDISLKDSGRNGMIPTWFGTLNKVWLLDLDSNALTGPIPSEIGNMSSLRFLLLNRNELTGPIPAQLGSLSLLRLVLLENNTISGSADVVCPAFVGGTNLVADCAGPIPEVSCTCCVLCCSDDERCNDQDFFAQQDPIREQNYTRLVYDFTIDYNITR